MISSQVNQFITESLINKKTIKIWDFQVINNSKNKLFLKITLRVLEWKKVDKLLSDLIKEMSIHYNKKVEFEIEIIRILKY